jgi:hypothetical protein
VVSLSRTLQPPDPTIIAHSDWPDPDTERARKMLADPPLSRETVYRLAKRGEISGYVLAGRRLWSLTSIRAFKARQIAKGLQFAPENVKRKPGRPAHPKPEATAAE